MDCCSGNKKPDTVLCPSCNKKGSSVQTETLRCLLLNAHLPAVDQEINYRYCKTPNCNVSYYSSRPNHFFKSDDLKIKATHKDHGLDVKVCYCFEYTRQHVLDEIRETGESTVTESIKSKMKDPGCYCQKSNPQGACCLGNVAEWIEEVQKMKL